MSMIFFLEKILTFFNQYLLREFPSKSAHIKGVLGVPKNFLKNIWPISLDWINLGISQKLIDLLFTVDTHPI